MVDRFMRLEESIYFVRFLRERESALPPAFHDYHHHIISILPRATLSTLESGWIRCVVWCVVCI